MSGTDLGILGNFIVGPGGLALMTTAWSLGVASAAIPVILKRHFRYVMPGFATLTLLALIGPRGLSDLMLFAILVTRAGVIIVPTLWLVGLDDPLNPPRAARLLSATACTLVAVPFLPPALLPVKILAALWLVVAVSVAVPISLISVGQARLRSQAWLPGVISSAAFIAAWLTWRASIHYNRLWEQAWAK